MNKQMTFEKQNAAVPSQLKSTQEWFAGIITNRMTENQDISAIAPSGLLIAEEAARYIIPSPTLRPHQRVKIYNQQYWWRLLNTLHDNFPLLTRLFGHQAFNEEIGIPYLMQYPPNHWSLNFLGERLTKWIAEQYQEPDQPLILSAAQLDWAFMASFIAPHHSPLDLTRLVQENPDRLLAQTFYLQPHIQLFKWDYDLLTFRESFLKQSVDYWIDNDFPALLKEKTYYFIVYRSQKHYIAWKTISSGEFTLLSVLQRGSSIDDACEYLERQDVSIYNQAASHLQEWFQDWTLRQWLTLESPQDKQT